MEEPTYGNREDIPTETGGTYLRKQGVPTYRNRGDLPPETRGIYQRKQGVPTYGEGYLPTKSGPTYLQICGGLPTF